MFKRISIILLILFTLLAFTTSADATIHAVKDAGGTYVEWLDELGNSLFKIDDDAGVTVPGGFSATGTFTLTNPAVASNAVYGLINAGVVWSSSGNLVGVRGKVVITAAGITGDATGVWAGIEITSASVQRFGLQVGMNVEAYSSTACLPNAVLYIQSLPYGASSDFSDVPYLVFSETVTSGAGSHILFEVGHMWANTIPDIGEDELFYNDTLQIAVNEQAGVRTPFFIPLSTDSGTFTTEYPIVSTYGSGLDASANAIEVTITDPLIDGAETLFGVSSTITSTDAVGWTAGDIAPIHGFLHIATLSPGDYASGAAGRFELEYDSALTADGVGMTTGVYIYVENQIAGKAPASCLYIEEETSGAGNQGNMPMVILTSRGTAGDKSQYAFSFGFAPAGTTVSTEDGGDASMFRTGGNAATNIVLKQGIQVIVNGGAYYIPLIAVGDWSDD